jgi:hypothetical protein
MWNDFDVEEYAPLPASTVRRRQTALQPFELPEGRRAMYAAQALQATITSQAAYLQEDLLRKALEEKARRRPFRARPVPSCHVLIHSNAKIALTKTRAKIPNEVSA